MKLQCKHCLPKEGIEFPALDLSDKARLLNMKQQSPINAVKYLIENFEYSHQESKCIVAHINVIYGQCHRCNRGSLQGEHVTCLSCGAFNFNWKA